MSQGSVFEKAPKGEREQGKTKAEAKGEMHVVRCYNWPALKAMGRDKKAELEELGYKPLRKVDTDGNVWDMQKPMVEVEALRKQCYDEFRGVAPGEPEVIGSGTELSTAITATTEVENVTGHQVAGATTRDIHIPAAGDESADKADADDNNG